MVKWERSAKRGPLTVEKEVRENYEQGRCERRCEIRRDAGSKLIGGHQGLEEAQVVSDVRGEGDGKTRDRQHCQVCQRGNFIQIGRSETYDQQ